MANSITDRNLLFGILALQMDFITRDQLVAAMQAWLLDKSKALGEILQGQGAMSSAHHQLLEPLVQAHIQQHGNDPQQSLAAVSSMDALKQELEQLADADLSRSVGTIGFTPAAEGPGSGDPATTGFNPTVVARTAGAKSPDPAGATRFRILRPHAKGGLGQVSVALDLELQREVALKEIQDHYADYDDSRQRFLKEGEITGKLEHPGIVPVYGLGQYADGRPFYAMRFIQGDSLKDAIERFHRPDRQGQSDSERTLELRKLLGRFLDVCNAIAYAHSRGVLHRDLKPGNIMLGQYGETLVVDWGLAKVLGQHEPESTLPAHPVQVASGSGATPTEMGKALGTPAYMSPEQAGGRLDELGPASDVFSLGATLYCLLTGHAPIENVTALDAVQRVQKGDFPRPRQVNPAVPPALEAVCLKAMALKPEDRYATVRALADDVERWLADDPVSAWPEPATVRASRWVRRHRTLVSTAVAAVLVAVVGLGAATLLLQAANEDLKNANVAEATAKEIAEQKKAEAETLKAIADKEKTEAQTQKGIADKQKALAEGRAQDLAEALAKVEKAEANIREQFAKVADVTGLLAQEAWDTDKVERAHELLLEIPPEFRAWDWHYRKRHFQGSYATLFGHTHWVTSVAWSPDGLRLASGSGDRTVKVWDAGAGRELFNLRGHTGGVISVAFSPDGRRLASGSEDTTVQLWDNKGQRLLSLGKHTGPVHSLCFSPDGRHLASGSEDRTVKVWETATGQELFTLRGHMDRVASVAFSPDGRRLASASHDKTIKLWDLAAKREALTLRGHAREIAGVAFSPDGGRLASGSLDQTVKLWDSATGKELHTLRGHKITVSSVSFSPDGRRLASGSGDSTVKLWDAATGQELQSLRGHTGGLTGVSFSPDGRRLASSGDTVKLWDAATGSAVLSLRGHADAVHSVAFSPDSQQLASGSEDRIHLWDAATTSVLFSLRGHRVRVTGLAFSPDGRRLASASEDKTLKIWDTATGQELLSLPGHTDFVTSVAFSPDGSRLVSGSRDSTVKLWDTATGKELLTLRGHMITVSSVAFSPSGRRVASGSVDQTIKMWDATTGRELLKLRGHTDAVSSVSFSPDGRRLASSSHDSTVKLWDAATGRELLSLHGGALRVLQPRWPATSRQ